jgi:hypothetical protein
MNKLHETFIQNSIFIKYFSKQTDGFTTKVNPYSTFASKLRKICRNKLKYPAKYKLVSKNITMLTGDIFSCRIIIFHNKEKKMEWMILEHFKNGVSDPEKPYTFIDIEKRNRRLEMIDYISSSDEEESDHELEKDYYQLMVLSCKRVILNEIDNLKTTKLKIIYI